jgi:hypothetical protein
VLLHRLFVSAAGVTIDRRPSLHRLARPNGLICCRSRDRLAVDKVIHHHNIVFLIIIRAWCRVAGCDPDSCDERLFEHDAGKGKARIAWRSRDETAEQHLVVGAEILNQRARLTVLSLLTVSSLRAMPLPSGWSTSVKTAPKPRTVARTAPLVPGRKNKASVMLLPTGVNNRNGLKVLKMLP